MIRVVLTVAALAAAPLLVLVPSTAAANCGDGECAVGALGNGGANSEGRAHGYHYTKPWTEDPDQQISNSGNLSSGRLNVADGSINLSGHFNDKKGAVSGHSSGGEFGESSGQCTYEAFDAGECK
jgi:hypothetical protein